MLMRGSGIFQTMILLDVIAEHLEEADFLCQQRGNALGERVYNLDRFTELEERLLAHLDGLILAEGDAWNFLKPKLTEGDVGEAFTASFVALASGEATCRDEFTRALDRQKVRWTGPTEGVPTPAGATAHLADQTRAWLTRRAIGISAA